MHSPSTSPINVFKPMNHDSLFLSLFADITSLASLAQPIPSSSSLCHSCCQQPSIAAHFPFLCLAHSFAMDLSSYDPSVIHSKKFEKTFAVRSAPDELLIDAEPFMLCGLQFRAFHTVDFEELQIDDEFHPTPFFFHIAMLPTSLHCLSPKWRLKGYSQVITYSYGEDGIEDKSTHQKNHFEYNETTSDIGLVGFDHNTTKIHVMIEIESYVAKFEEICGSKILKTFHFGSGSLDKDWLAPDQTFFLCGIQFCPYVEVDHEEFSLPENCDPRPYSLKAKPTEEGKKLLLQLGKNWRFFGIMTVSLAHFERDPQIVNGKTRVEFDFCSWRNSEYGLSICCFDKPISSVSVIFEASFEMKSQA